MTNTVKLILEDIGQPVTEFSPLLQQVKAMLDTSPNFNKVEVRQYKNSTKCYIYAVSKLKGENDFHKQENERFEIADRKNGVMCHYIPNGDVEVYNSLDQIKSYLRA